MCYVIGYVAIRYLIGLWAQDKQYTIHNFDFQHFDISGVKSYCIKSVRVSYPNFAVSSSLEIGNLTCLHQLYVRYLNRFLEGSLLSGGSSKNLIWLDKANLAPLERYCTRLVVWGFHRPCCVNGIPDELNQRLESCISEVA